MRWREASGLAVKRIDAVDKDLILPLWKTCKRLKHIVPGHGKKHHFASYRFFPCCSRCPATKLQGNLPQAFGSSAVAEFYLIACSNHPFCKRLCEISCSYGSNFHALSFLIWICQ